MIDEKLRGIIDDCTLDGEWTLRVIAQIKQAFMEEGWLDSSKISFPQDTSHAAGLMTGQEWFNCFDGDFRTKNFLYHNKTEQRLIKDITIAAYDSARKASGLEREKMKINNYTGQPELARYKVSNSHSSRVQEGSPERE